MVLLVSKKSNVVRFCQPRIAPTPNKVGGNEGGEVNPKVSLNKPYDCKIYRYSTEECQSLSNKIKPKNQPKATYWRLLDDE